MRAFNFSAGPAALPEQVLEQARDELLEWGSERASVMEVSHRGKAFIACAERAEADLRALLAIPQTYRVLFLQGGATQHFAQIPMNLARPDQAADYLLSGHWSEKAFAEARHYCHPQVAGSSAAGGYRDIPERIQPSDAAAYLHYTPNETIHGVEFHQVPDAGGLPLVADMSSTILSRPLDISRFALVYAGAQKNIGPAGLVDVPGHGRARCAHSRAESPRRARSPGRGRSAPSFGQGQTDLGDAADEEADGEDQAEAGDELGRRPEQADDQAGDRQTDHQQGTEQEVGRAAEGQPGAKAAFLLPERHHQKEDASEQQPRHHHVGDREKIGERPEDEDQAGQSRQQTGDHRGPTDALRTPKAAEHELRATGEEQQPSHEAAPRRDVQERERKGHGREQQGEHARRDRASLMPVARGKWLCHRPSSFTAKRMKDHPSRGRTVRTRAMKA